MDDNVVEGVELAAEVVVQDGYESLSATGPRQERSQLNCHVRLTCGVKGRLGVHEVECRCDIVSLTFTREDDLALVVGSAWAMSVHGNCKRVT